MKKINAFIKKRPHLIWYTKNYAGLSEESIVEHVLNYGTWEDVQEMIRILGMKKTAKIFRIASARRRCNYREKTKHFFTIFFNKYA